MISCVNQVEIRYIHDICDPFLGVTTGPPGTVDTQTGQSPNSAAEII